MEHRAEAQKLSGITVAQLKGLSLGRRKGTNNRTGYRHRAESKRKVSEANKKWCAENPDKVALRGEKVRGESHYKWKGGLSKLSQSIRQMNEYRKWVDAVRHRDGCKSVRCSSTVKLESHHIKTLAKLLEENSIQSRDQARNCLALWELSNGETLCEECHYKEHERKYENRRNDIQESA